MAVGRNSMPLVVKGLHKAITPERCHRFRASQHNNTEKASSLAGQQHWEPFSPLDELQHRLKCSDSIYI